MADGRAGIWMAGLAALVLSGGGATAADLNAKQLPVEAAAPAASAPFEFVFGARIQSDYNFRGISQSDHRESGQTYGEAQFFDNFAYLGFATYKTDLPTRPLMEFDLTGGIRPKFGPFTFDLGFIYYNYPFERPLFGVPPLANTDFLEFAGKVSYNYEDMFIVGANVFHTGNFVGTHADGTYVSGTAKYNIPEGFLGAFPSGFALSAEFGHYFLGRTAFNQGGINLPDYNYGNVGLSYTYKAYTLDVRYHNTDLRKTECFTISGDPRGFITGSGRSNWCGDAVIATLSVDIVASKMLEQLGLEAPAVPR